MGVDLMCLGGEVSFNWTAWQTLYDLGLAFGWRPAGTLPATISDGGRFDTRPTTIRRRRGADTSPTIFNG